MLFDIEISLYICIYKNTLKTMDKSRKKKSVYNTEILIQLKNKYGFTRDYILKSIKGERTGTIPIKIQEEYKSLVSASNQAIQQQINKI